MNTPRKKQRLTQAERVALSDEKMIQAAIDLILEHGTDKTTLKEVGERAGYSRGLAGARFGTKEGLFKRILQAHRVIWFGSLKQCTQGKQGLESILSRIDAIEMVLTHNKDNIKAMYTLWFDSLGHPSVLRKELEQYNRQSREDLTGIIKEGIQSGEFTDELNVSQFVIDFYSRVYGLIYQWLVSPEAVDIKSSLDSLKTYCQIMLPKKPS